MNLFLLVGGLGLCFFLKHLIGQISEHDERQLYYQRKAIEISFMVLVYFVAVLTIFHESLPAWLPLPQALSLGLSVTFSLFLSYIIWKDGYFSLKEGPSWWYTGMCYFLALSNSTVWEILKEWQLPEDTTFLVLDLSASLAWLSIALTLTIKSLLVKKEETDE